MAETPEHSAVKFKVTKCVAIQTQTAGAQDRSKPKWMKYMHISSPNQGLSICERSDWKSANDDHALLHIDIPNGQVYPLPLLVTPAPCVYLVAFDLPEGKEEEKEALKGIRDTLKDVYTYSSCTELKPDGLVEDAKVFLVGLQRGKEEGRNRSSFARQLKEMLEARSYERLIVFPDDLPYWTNPCPDPGAEFSLCDNSTLLRELQSICYPQPQQIYQLLACHHMLHQLFSGHAFVPYERIEAKMATIVPDLEQFLKVLHCFGFIFYRPLPESDLEKSKNVVVLQPQYLRELFETVQKLSEKLKITTIEKLFIQPTTIMPDKKWFQVMCASMGLVIERPTVKGTEYIFVMGLDSKCDLPERAHYSIDPLLVSYMPSDIQQMPDDYLLPSLLFPAFITTFMKKLEEKGKMKGNPIALKRHYLHVKTKDLHGTQILVVERDSFIEIGLRQFHLGKNSTQDEMLGKLQESCHAIYDVVTESAECATDRLRLVSQSLQYGFVCQSVKDKIDRFGQFEPDDGSICCCDIPQEPTPQQKIWFQEVTPQEAEVRPFQIPGGKIRKLESAFCTCDGSDPTVPEPMKSNVNPTENPSSPSFSHVPKPQTLEASASVTVKQVLHFFWDRFIKEVDALTIVYDLLHKDIIAPGDLKGIHTTDNPTLQNKILHNCLTVKCTKEALMTVCKIIIAVEGNPKMKALGRDMQSMLGGTKQHARGHVTGRPAPQPHFSEIQRSFNHLHSETDRASERPKVETGLASSMTMDYAKIGQQHIRDLKAELGCS